MSNAKPLRVAVLISGNGTNLQVIIDAAKAGKLKIELVAVISDRPGAYGLKRAENAGIRAITIDYKSFDIRPDFDERLDYELQKLDVDLVVLAGYMRILWPDTVLRFRGRMINVHPSLLPKYPGLHTHARVLKGGDAWHGSTVHFVIPELDAGPPIIQYRIHVKADDTEQSLQQRVQTGEYLIYPRVISWITSGRIKLEKNVVYKDDIALNFPILVDENLADDSERLW